MTTGSVLAGKRERTWC